MSTECFAGPTFLSRACRNLFHPVFSFRVAQKREDAVSKEVTRKLSEADNRKMSRKEKDERFDVCVYVHAHVCVYTCIPMCVP